MEASWTDRVKNEVLQRFKAEGNIIRGINRRKAKWTGHRFPRNCLSKRLIEEKIQETGRRGKVISSYWMPLRKRKDPGNLKRKH
jgi:hypothetical protein